MFPASFPVPLEELRWAERACRGLRSVWFPHTDSLGLHLIVQRRSGNRTVVLRRPRFVEGLAGFLPFRRGGRNVRSLHAAEVLLSKLSKFLVAEVEHGGLLQEKVAVRLEFVNFPFQSLALLS